ncbi:MAG: DUF1732 domain-containing protein [Candidatus Omnitrophica bacterium]|nr:DUF1732 domain-containing protein [Candidatus Omnitrophota bacterium]
MRSMTAYAYIYKRKDSRTLQLTLRSLNFKYLDISVRNLPAESILLEEKIKKEIKKRVSRGKIEAYVFLKQLPEQEVQIEEKALAKYIFQAKKLAKKYNLKADLSISDFLNLPHVVSWKEKKGIEENLILPALREGMDKLLEFKKREGRAIEQEISKNLRKLDYNIGQIKKSKPRIKKAENNKEDIEEEISLISFYTKKLEKDITSRKTISMGKTIDFLTQEILRELNAASSKTKDKIPSALIVEAKTYIERIREQAQNIE